MRTDEEWRMAEGLASSEVAGEISRHKTHSAEHASKRDDVESDDGERDHDRTLSIIEAVMLAIVALLAANTGFASAKWNTERRHGPKRTAPP